MPYTKLYNWLLGAPKVSNSKVKKEGVVPEKTSATRLPYGRLGAAAGLTGTQRLLAPTDATANHTAKPDPYAAIAYQSGLSGKNKIDTEYFEDILQP